MLVRLLMLYVFGITVLGCGAPGRAGAPSLELENTNQPSDTLLFQSEESGNFAIDPTTGNGIQSAEEVQSQQEPANSVVLLSQKDLGTLCTGVLIDKHLVLTAAHCARGVAEQSVVLFTNDYFGKDIPLRQVRKFHVHEDYGRFKGADRRDLALVMFEGNLPKGFRPIEIATAAQIDSLLLEKKDLDFVAFGYGTAEKNQKYFGNAGLLRNAHFVAPNFDKKKNYFVLEQVSGPALCHGDSGGPGIVKVDNQLRLVGLASAVFGKDSKAAPNADPCRFKALYMNLVSLKPWIYRNINLLKSYRGPGQVP